MMARPWLWLLLWVSGTALGAGWQDALPNAQVVGSGDLRVYGFRIYTARMWSATKPLQANKPFALELTYHRSIAREDLVAASIDEIKRTSGSQVTTAQLAQWRQQMQQAFVDVQEGTTIVGVNVPGREARFYVNDQLRHVVLDPAFAKAFFDIWLDPDTRNADLREKLLGTARP
ncbi:MAG TPA: chalcone isomerase family protein [Pseudomonas sp.]